jgi:hypothetical protein
LFDERKCGYIGTSNLGTLFDKVRAERWQQRGRQETINNPISSTSMVMEY